METIKIKSESELDNMFSNMLLIMAKTSIEHNGFYTCTIAGEKTKIVRDT